MAEAKSPLDDDTDHSHYCTAVHSKAKRNQSFASLMEKRKIDTHISNLSAFLEDLHSKTEMTTYNIECEDIYKSVTEMVWLILHLVEKMYPIFKVSKLLPVGSFAEGTRLMKPSEFDFVAEINCLSSDGKTDCIAECSTKGTIHLLLKDLDLVPTVDSIIYKGKICDTTRSDFVYISPVAFRVRFSSAFTTAGTQLMQQGFEIQKKSGILGLFTDLQQCLDMYTSGPNIEIEMHWTSKHSREKFGICVDVSPIVNISDKVPDSCGLNVDLLKSDMINGRHQMCVVPTFNIECEHAKGYTNIDDQLCWRLSFSVTETLMVQRLNDCHKKCLRLLKYVKSKFTDPIQELEELGMPNLSNNGLCSINLRLHHHSGDMNLLTTYMLKMAVLRHSLQCKKDDIGECMLDILKYMRNCAEDRFLPNIFIPKKNCWSRLSKKAGVGPHIIKPHLDNLIALFEDIVHTEDYCFSQSFEKFTVVQRELTENDGC